MTKNDLPVIILKGLVLLPLSEARIELNNDITKKIIDIARDNYADEVLIVSPVDTLEESPDSADLPMVAVKAKITSRIDLPNKNVRIILSGINRQRILRYYNDDIYENILLASAVDFPKLITIEAEEIALTRKLINDLEYYISVNPNISNSIINQIKTIDNLETLTDVIASFLPLSHEKKTFFMLEHNKIIRAKKLIEEISIELEVLNIENRIDEKLRVNLDNMQKEMILKEKINIIKKEIGETNAKEDFILEINEKINEKDVPENIKKRVLDELRKYENTLESSPELSVIRTYIETLLSIPFNKTTKDETSLKKVEEKLNESHYGLDEVKTRILENVSLKLNNENSSNEVICLIGPPGVGKTTLASSIANALKRKFAKISLGGLNDPNELTGHRRTYLGSEPGKIISTLIKTESTNPVILLDEVDKMHSDYKGDPTGVLLDLLDPNQSKTFTDNYIEEPIDLSKVLFILTANDINEIPRVLLDRLDVINLNSYLDYEKEAIATNYLIKNNLKNAKLKEDQIIFEEETIKSLIDDYTKESGVRNLDRLINRIIKKVITKYRLEDKKLKKEVIRKEDLYSYLKSPIYKDERNKSKATGYVLGLAYTAYGGEVLEIEVTSYEGENKFITSGHLGDTLKESIEVALGYIKTNIKEFKIDKSSLNKTIHINFREGAVPKDGPSAGIMITTALLSHLLNKEVKETISGTGEITLLGDVLPVGGLREKCLSAIKNNIKTIYISIQNKQDIDDLPNEIKDKLKFKFIKNYKEMYEELFK